MPWAKQRGNKWYGRLRVNGKEVSTSIGRATREEAEADAERYAESIIDLSKFNPAWTLEQYWLAMMDHMRTTNEPRPQTVTFYERMVANLVLGIRGKNHPRYDSNDPTHRYPIAEIKFVALTQQDIISWWDYNLKRDLANNAPSQRTAKRMISIILHHGYRANRLWGISNLDGVMRSLKVKRTQKPEYRVMDRSEFSDLLSIPMPYAHQLFLRGFIATGCRPQEMHALMPEHFVPNSNDLNVCRAVAWGKNGEVSVGELKDKEARIIDVDPGWHQDVVAFVREHEIKRGQIIFSRDRMDVPNGGTPPIDDVDVSEEARAKLTPRYFSRGTRNYEHGTNNGYCDGRCRCDFCRAAARYHRRDLRERKGISRKRPEATRDRVVQRHPSINVSPRMWWTETLRRYADAAGLGWPTLEPYDFRHAFATWLAEGGEPVSQIQLRMGHASVVTTLGYIHVRRSRSRAVDILRGDSEAPVPSDAAEADDDVDPAMIAAVIRQLRKGKSAS